MGLEYERTQWQHGSMIIVDQLPKKGIVINTGTKVVINTESMEKELVIQM